MANLRVAPLNFIDDSSIVPDSELTTLPAINVQNVSRSKVWRTATGATSYQIKGNWSGGTRRSNCFFIFGHNLLSKPGGAASYRLRLFSNSSYGGSTLYDSGTVSATPIGGGTLSYDWGYSTGSDRYDPNFTDSPIALFFTEAAAQSWQLDLTNFFVISSEYAQIRRLFLGRYFETTYNPKLGSPVLGWETNSDQIRTRGGSLHTNEGEYWRTLQFDLEWISEAQRYVWMDVMRKAGLARDVVVSMFPGSGDRLDRDYTINGKFTSLDAITHTTNVYRTKRVTVKEC